MNKPLSQRLVALFIYAVTVVGCSSSPGPDTMSSSGASANCAACHSAATVTRRQIMGAGGDFRGNSAIVSNHVTTTGDPTPAQCLVCHDLATHMSGVVRLRNADGGASIVYSAATPASLEPFCLSCHDTLGATSTFAAGGTPLRPFNDNNTLGSVPNVAGNKIRSYWTGTNNRHKTTGALTCAGTGAATTGCHGNNGAINMHGSVSKGLLTQNLTLPVPDASLYAYNDYKLCFDCHSLPGNAAVSPQVVLGYKAGGNYDVTQVPPIASFVTLTATIQSLFRERYIASSPNIPFYNDTIGIDSFPYLPLHNYHLLSTFTFFSTNNVLSWQYRGDPAQVGRISCVTCHNVHGTNGGSARSTFDELGVTSAATGTDLYSTMTDSNYNNPPVMESYPMNCNVNSCHGLSNKTYYWNSPANE